MSFKLTIQSNALSFTADQGESILAAALRNGVNLPYGCRNGACGSCKGRVLAGTIEYRDQHMEGITMAEKQAGYALFCQAIPVTDIVIEARLVDRLDDIPIRRLPCRVAKIDRLNYDVMRLFLKLPATERLQFVAGQYIDIHMQNGKRRSFSLANNPYDDEYLELHVRYYNGGLFSEYAFNELQEKTLLRIEGPLGSFFLREDSDRPIILVAGGTGFAPVKSIIEYAVKKQMNRPLYFYWGARSKRDLYMHDLVCDWQQSIKNFHYMPVLSEPLASDQWNCKTGLVHEAILHDFASLSEFEVYACGPPPMVKAAGTTFIKQGLPANCFFSDSFEFAAPNN
jgi:CDP-4-dehydro-6-deoxyglucose reductase, E3